MKSKLIESLKEYGYPIFLQGSLGRDENYPDHFFTYWNNEVADDQFYDNREHRYLWDFDLNFYSVNPALVDTMLNDVKKRLEVKGFVVRGKGHDLASDEPTHTGRGINILIMEKQEGQK